MFRQSWNRKWLFGVLVSICNVAVAGSLTPPAGPVAPTQRRLITALPFTISVPGSYVVTGDLTGVAGQNGITINSHDVTIDLNGFTLRGVPGSLTGIAVVSGPAWKNIVILNGTVRNWGGDGINLVPSNNTRLEGVNATGNSNYGIAGHLGFRAEKCGANENGIWGIGVFGANGSLSDCTASSNGGHGMSGAQVVRHCTASFNGGDGISAGSGGTIVSSEANSNSGYGFSLGGATRISDSAAQNNSYGGISAYLGDSIAQCTASYNNGPGIVGYGADLTISNTAASNNNGSGILIDSGEVSHCTASNNQINGIEILLGNSAIESCTACRNKGDGILLADRSTATSNTCSENGALMGGYGAGIYCYGFQSRIDSNHVSGNDVGIDASLPVRNTIMRNSATTNTFDYNIHPMNDFAPISTAAFSTNPWANISY